MGQISNLVSEQIVNNILGKGDCPFIRVSGSDSEETEDSFRLVFDTKLKLDMWCTKNELSFLCKRDDRMTDDYIYVNNRTGAIVTVILREEQFAVNGIRGVSSSGLEIDKWMPGSEGFYSDDFIEIYSAMEYCKDKNFTYVHLLMRSIDSVSSKTYVFPRIDLYWSLNIDRAYGKLKKYKDSNKFIFDLCEYLLDLQREVAASITSRPSNGDVLHRSPVTKGDASYHDTIVRVVRVSETTVTLQPKRTSGYYIETSLIDFDKNWIPVTDWVNEITSAYADLLSNCTNKQLIDGILNDSLDAGTVGQLKFHKEWLGSVDEFIYWADTDNFTIEKTQLGILEEKIYLSVKDHRDQTEQNMTRYREGTIFDVPLLIAYSKLGLVDVDNNEIEKKLDELCNTVCELYSVTDKFFSPVCCTDARRLIRDSFDNVIALLDMFTKADSKI